MRIKMLCLFAAVSILLWFACSGASYITVDVLKPAEINLSGVKTVAVVDFQGPVRSGSQIATYLQSYLLNTGYFDLLEREKLKRILDEQDLGLSGVVDRATAVKVGKLLGVQAMIFGEVTTYEVERDQLGVDKVEKEVGTGRYEYISKKDKKTGKVERTKREIMETVIIDRPYRIRRGSVGANFRIVKVETGQLAAVHSDMKTFVSDKIYRDTGEVLPPKAQILTDLSRVLCEEFVHMIAPHTVTESWYIESGDDRIKEGTKYAEAGLWPEAMEVWSAAIRENPDDPAGYYNLGLAYEVQGDLDKAEEYYGEALRLKMDNHYMAAISRIRQTREDQEILEEQLQNR